jgi:hypothetical protein
MAGWYNKPAAEQMLQELEVASKIRIRINVMRIRNTRWI